MSLIRVMLSIGIMDIVTLIRVMGKYDPYLRLVKTILNCVNMLECGGDCHRDNQSSHVCFSLSIYIILLYGGQRGERG